MKRTLIAIFSAMILASCGQIVPEESPKYVEVSFKMAGEIASVADAPLTKANTTITMYGVQVYRLATGTMAGVPMPSHYEPYAHGVFTSQTELQNARVALLENETYKFEIQVVDNFTYDSSMYPAPPYPFMGGAGESFNQFTASPMDLSLQNVSYLPGSYDRYYGFVDGFVPDVNDPSKNIVTVDAYHMSFGLKVIINNLTEGSVNTTINNWENLTITHDPSNTSGTFEADRLLLMNNFGSAFDAAVNRQDYTESRNLSFIWTKANGSTVPLIPARDFTFHRNMMTTITINILGDNPEGGVEINFGQSLGESLLNDPTNYNFDSGTTIQGGSGTNQQP